MPLTSFVREHYRFILLSLSFFALLMAAYSNHYDNGFYFDDTHTITGNTYIRDIGNIPSFFIDIATFGTMPNNRGYRPVVTTLNAVDYWMAGGLKSNTFHRTIMFWYVVQAILMVVFFKRVIDICVENPLNRYYALFITAFYTLHVANADTINYIIARSDSFSTLCIIASLILYQHSKTRKWHLYLITMLMGICTKETGYMFVPLLFFYICLFEERVTVPGLTIYSNWRGLARSLLKTLPAALAAVGFFYVHVTYLSPETSVTGASSGARLSYLTTQFTVLLHYLGNFLLPLNLSADPDFVITATFLDQKKILGLFVILALLAAAAVFSRKRETLPVSYGIIWFFVALAPTSSIIPMGQVANSHRTFFPFVGLSLAAGWSVVLLLARYRAVLLQSPARKGLLVPALVAVFMLHAYGVYQRNEVWNSAESLWCDVTVKSPNNGRGLMNYGLSQMEKGRYEVAHDYFLRAVKLMPSWPYVHINLGILRNAMGFAEEAEGHFRNALRYGSGNPEPYYYYARWLKDRGEYDRAADLAERGLMLSPGHAGLAAMTRDLPAAVEAREDPVAYHEKTARAEPTAENYLALSLAYYRAGRYEDCIRACRKALAVRPDYAGAFNNICAAHNQLQQWDQAVDACKRALAISPDFPLARNNLDWALAERKN
ncbi:MAG: tetratricopeptide repeat protein [Deltaproteobacteria bacterium]|nr:tetratricopeptide repeat protein [Deltaproteobacteria bacterium]